MKWTARGQAFRQNAKARLPATQFSSAKIGLEELGDSYPWTALAGPAGKDAIRRSNARRFPLAKDAEGAKAARGRAGSGNPFARGDAEGAENVLPGSDPG